MSAALLAARPRWRSALLAGALLVGSAPLVARAFAPALSCGVTQTGRWERIPIRSFQPISGLAASQNDTVTGYGLDRAKPQDVGATNGSSVLLSRSQGCSWNTAFELSPTPTAQQPFAGLTSSVVSVGLLGGRVLAAVQEGSGSASRPHVMVSSSGSSGTFAASDGGLPAQGAPRLLRTAGDGRTAYLTISPTASGGDSGGTTGILPGLPGGGVTPTTPTGLLYKSSDGGASWTLQTRATDLPSGGAGLSALDIDAASSDVLYGLVNGTLVVSRDGGGSFATPVTGTYSAITAMGRNQVAAFTSGGQGVLSSDGGAHFNGFPAPAGVTSAAYRDGSTSIVVESSGTLRELTPGLAASAIPAAAPARRGSLIGDRSAQSSLHALAGHALLRYVDPAPRGTVIPPLAAGDLTVPPPFPGTISPGIRNVSLPVGSSQLEDFTLNLPKNPTPLDLFFLVDVSSSMDEYINDVKANIGRIVNSLTAARIDLKVGIGTIGTGPAEGEAEYPPAYVYPPVCGTSGCQADPRSPYIKPALYRRLYPVGDTGPKLSQALTSLKLETVPQSTAANPPQNHEGQLIALKNLAEGRGTKSQADVTAGTPTYSAVPPHQEAGFRGSPNVRHIVIMATNEKFDNPFGTDHKTNGKGIDADLNFAPTIQVLRANRIQVVGLTVGANQAQPDLETIARGTGALTPAGGVDCGGDPDVQLNPGQPLVCGNADQFSGAIVRVLASFVDRQNVQLVPVNRSPVLGALNGGALRGLDVKKPNSVGFTVNVSCVDVKPGTYHQTVDAVLRQTVVGAARLNVSCVQAAAAVPPKVIPAAVSPNNPPPPAAQPVGNVVPPIAPPAPAAQPQVNPQVQTQVQIQPLTAGAIQEQQELQLALAMNGTLQDDDPVFNAGQQLAMVDRRRREEVQALGVLAFAITACAGVGLARLRSRPEPGVRHAR